MAQVPNGGAPGYQGSEGSNATVNAYAGYFDYGGGNPNTDYNPKSGQYDQGANNFSSGGDSDPSTTLPTTVNAATSPNNQEYHNWSWEEILNVVMTLGLPDRGEISNGRWTGIETGSSGDAGRFYIYGVTWTNIQGHQDSLVYLAPALTTPNAPWPVFVNNPAQALSSLVPGPDDDYLFSANGPTTSLDPSTFVGPITALGGAESYYANATQTLGNIVAGLGDDNTQFQGQAGGAFTQLVGGLYQQVNYVSTTIGTPDPHSLSGYSLSSYSQQLWQAGEAAGAFMYSIRNAYAAWSNLMEFSPLGAILAALIQKGVVVGTPGNWDINSSMVPRDSPFGDLSTDAAWVEVETLAKQLWNSTLVNALDYAAQNAVQELIEQYNDTAMSLKELSPPPVQPITTNAAPNVNNVASDTNNALNSLFDNDQNLAGAMDGVIGDINSLGNGLGSLYGGLNNTDSGLGSLYDGLNNTDSGLGSLYGGLNSTDSGLGSLLGGSGNPNNALNGSGSTTSGALQQALDDNEGTQNALQSALSGGEVSPDSRLGTALQSALNGSNQVQSALNTAAAADGTTSGKAALNNALTDNQAVQKALNEALASGQVPATGPLRSALDKALADTNSTSTALHQALAGQGVLTEPNIGALSSSVGLAGVGAGSGLASSALRGGLGAGGIGTSGLGASGLGTSASTPLLTHVAPAAAAASAPVSSGAFVSPATQTAATTETSAGGAGDAFPMYSPMAGGGGMMGGAGQMMGNQERERSTWLAEDEEIWGTDPSVGPQVIGRNFAMAEEPEDDDAFAERPSRPAPQRPQPRRMDRR
jgi:hypothetical protein